MLQVEGSSRDQQSRKKQIKSSCNLENTEAVSFQFLARTVQTLAQPCCSHTLYKKNILFYPEFKTSSPTQDLHCPSESVQ
jgi:hypothetical protein